MRHDDKRDEKDRPKDKGGKDEPRPQPLEGDEPPPPPPPPAPPGQTGGGPEDGGN